MKNDKTDQQHLLPHTLHLANDLDRIRFLAHAREQFPEIFHDHGAYHIDPLEVLEQNEKLLRLLKKLPLFHQLQRERPPVLNFHFKQGRPRIIRSVQLSSLALKKYQRDLKKRIDKLDKVTLTGSSSPLLERIVILRKAPSTHQESMEELSELVQIFILVQQLDGSIPENPSELKGMISKVKEAHLDYFTDMVTLQRKMRPLEDILGLQKKEMVKKHIHRFMERLFRQTVTIKKTTTLSLILEECPPFLGIFRGSLGEDCSTQHSSGYALSPMERIFVIKSPKGHRFPKKSYTHKGYMSSTVVMANGKKCLYVHTIAGPQLSGAEAKFILQGLHLIRQELEVECILLPAISQLDNLLNYLDIKKTFKDLVKKGAKSAKKKKVTYLDSSLRKKIALFVPEGITYDEPEANRTAYLYRPSSQEMRHVMATLSSPDLPSWKDHPLTNEEGILLALHFLKMGHVEQSQRVAKALGVDLNGLMKLKT